MDAKREIHLWDYWLILRKRKGVILLTIFILVLVAYLINTFQEPVYQTKAELVFQSNFPGYLPGKEVLQPKGQLDSVYFYTQFKIIEGHSFAEKVANRIEEEHYQILPDYFKNLPVVKKHKQLVSKVQKSLKVSRTPKTHIIYLTTRGSVPEFITKITNVASQTYVEGHRKSQKVISQENIVFLTNKLEELKDKLKQSGLALESFPQIQSIKSQIYDIDVKLQELSNVYGPNHPKIIELKEKKGKLEKQLEDEIKRETTYLKPLSSDMMALKNEINEEKDLSDKLSIQDETKGEVTKEKIRHMMLQREALINEQMYQTLLKKLRETDVTKSIEPISVRVLEEASLPRKPIKPDKKLNLGFGLLLGITLGTGLAFFREYLDTTLKTTEDVEKYLGLSILGVIPSMETIIKSGKEKKSAGHGKKRFRLFQNKIDEHRRHKKSPEKLKRISIKEELKSPISESYRALRTNLQFACVDKDIKTIMVTSPARGEGKTTTTINLGIILAQTGKKVLLVDTDLRRPRLHHTFNLRRERGITSLLVSEDLQPADCILNTDIDNLYVIPSGPLPPNPSEILGSEKVNRIFSDLKTEFDYILLDTPPLMTVTDAAVLSSREQAIDSIVIVIKAAQTPREVAIQGLSSLDKVKNKILGAILNSINVEKGSYYYYYYHYDYAYGYKYGYGDEKEKVKT